MTQKRRSHVSHSMLPLPAFIRRPSGIPDGSTLPAMQRSQNPVLKNDAQKHQTSNICSNRNMEAKNSKNHGQLLHCPPAPEVKQQKPLKSYRDPMEKDPLPTNHHFSKKLLNFGGVKKQTLKRTRSFWVHRILNSKMELLEDRLLENFEIWSNSLVPPESYCWWKKNHLGCIKPCKSWEKLTYQLVQDFFHQQYDHLTLR